MSNITMADLKKAEAEEAKPKRISSDHARYRGTIWGTYLSLGGPSLWLTINPADIYDPIAQIFSGENIDLDNFNTGPGSYASAQYFNFIILTDAGDTLRDIEKRRENSQVAMKQALLQQESFRDHSLPLQMEDEE
ncbi:hypothetical protein SCLCIDRAFT_28482 [Scleroderma citrinum Foug A]|uniref:Helitron helicase-like domain-containing protein n=1 Tax=Scleroderma citrinum Foug A TaxID=1036808 RepID=A0A0C3DP34_9AGAM|nr:hypothetical protein SCLCIDRAFT_28482 [Scleroderma citrinum Foug A]